MAKTKKKKNYRLRKSVRRTLGALFMISAIIVAAIPFPDAAATNGDTNNRNSSSTAEEVNYEVTNDTGINNGSVSLDPSGKNIQYSYGVYNVNNQWIYQWQFGFYDAGNDTSGGDGDKIGIISEYNNEYKVSEIKLLTTINTGYVTVDFDTYTNYFDGSVERKITYEDKNDENLRTEFQKYFKTTLDTFDANVKVYEKWLADNSNASNDEKETKKEKVTVIAKPSNLLPEQRSRYYCDYVIKSDRSADNDFYLKGLDFEMIAVDAYVRGENYCTKYIPKAINPTSTTAPAGYEIDKYGFIYPKNTACKLKGIGNESFKGITSIEILNLPENITYIGDSAFEESFVQDVTITYVTEIGNAAFKGCSLLESVDIQNQTKIIGTEAFADTNISSINLPYSVTKIGQGAFADNDNLTTITFPPNSNGDVEICNFAFYNCPNLSSLDLSDKKSITSIGKGAFALELSTEDGLTCTSFSFPSGISDATKLRDYILSNRTGLKDVIMPSALGSRMPSDNDTDKITIPSNTFKGCNGLGSVTFPDKNESGSCGYVLFDETLFSDVTNRSFYVSGPGTNYRNEIASPRKSTWKCSNAYDEAIPYVYTLNGKEVFEVSQVDETDSDKSYLMSVDENGILQSCNFTDGNNDNIIDEKDAFSITKLIIPGNIAGLAVKGLAEGCFSQPYEDFIDYIEELVISDGGELAEIGTGVFKGAEKLKKVYLGDSIQKIGAEAFMDCKALEEIEFSKPKSDKTELGTNALKTNGDSLIVTGIIKEGYSPFEWAMDPQNYVNNDGVRVLYKSPAPQSLSVILDNRNNLVTLVDYPHYGDLKEYRESPNDTPIDLTEIYENIIFNNEGELTLAQEALVNATLKIEIPAGIESIDVQGYLNNSSKTYDGVEPKTNNQSISKYFDVSDERFSSYMTYGLFNGNSSDASSGSAMADETKEIGNDCIKEIIMHTVKYLPNTQTKNRSTSNDVVAANGMSTGAFYSCEDLETVVLGDAMEDIGELPFLGCYNLNSVTSNSKNANGATKYVCQNKIIYENKDDGTVEIIECLGSRGNSQDGEVSVAIDNMNPGLKDVSSIAAGAFSDCPNLLEVNFMDNNKLTSIPDNAFFNSTSLRTLKFPENVRNFGKKVFSNCDKLDVYIYGKEVSMSYDTFDNTNAVVHTYKDTAAYNTAEALLGVNGVKPLEEGDPVYKVQFYDYDFKTTIGPEQEIKEGGSAVEPAQPTRKGYKFTGWSTDAWKKNVTEDLKVYAMYETDTSTTNNSNNSNNNNSNNNSNNSSNSNGNNNNDSTTNSDGTIKGDYVDGGIDTNGDGIPDVDEKGNKLYKLTVTNGEGSGYYKAGKTVNIKAGIAPKGTSFAYWSCSNNNLIFQDHTDWITTLTMVAEDVTVICNFDGQYTLEVEYGTGSGSYPAGAKVAISALEAPQGRKFASWVTKTNGLNIEDSTKATTIITMPQGNALITATYMDTPKGNVSGNSTPSKNNTSVVITKPGISDKNSASAYVSGSSDNFVVKISESLDAADEVQRALQKKYPDMSRIKYFAMDITLYDAKGENKITNTDNLKVNITMPIPDALREYAGNNRVGAVKNGELETLNPKFTTINGVPSVTFTATHFSPYTIYVDTGNMTATGTLDSTPKTGDGIHPKWFLSLGLACISIILFTKRDRRYTIKA